MYMSTIEKDEQQLFVRVYQYLHRRDTLIQFLIFIFSMVWQFKYLQRMKLWNKKIGISGLKVFVVGWISEPSKRFKDKKYQLKSALPNKITTNFMPINRHSYECYSREGLIGIIEYFLSYNARRFSTILPLHSQPIVN